MPAEFDDLSQRDQVELDNQFMKMKLMLEHNAQFGPSDKNDIPPELENEFLRHVMEFEKQFDEQKRIRVYDKIERPTHFKPSPELSDDELDDEWEKLSDHLAQYSIFLDVCSPNIPNRELYRFTLEELFDHEIDDINIPGFGTNFIYDEFHPDPLYECGRMVQNDLIESIFRAEPMFSEYSYSRDKIELNGLSMDYDEFYRRLKQFKSLYSGFNLIECTVEKSELIGQSCIVTGIYRAETWTEGDMSFFNGNFSVECVTDELAYWVMKRITIEDFNI